MPKLPYEVHKRDVTYLIIIGLLLFVVSVLCSGKTDGELVSHLSLASAVVSIVLAVVAILYTLMHSGKIQDALGQMGVVAKELAFRADTLEASTQKLTSVAEQNQLFEEASIKNTAGNGAGQLSLKGVDKKVDIETASLRGLKDLYWITRAAALGVPASWQKCFDVARTLTDDNGHYDHGYFLGLVAGTGSGIDYDEDTGIIKLSEDYEYLKEDVVKELERRIEGYKSGQFKGTTNLDWAEVLTLEKLRIDRFFDYGEVPDKKPNAKAE